MDQPGAVVASLAVKVFDCSSYRARASARRVPASARLAGAVGFEEAPGAAADAEFSVSRKACIGGASVHVVWRRARVRRAAHAKRTLVRAMQ
jgi:hypothetical protein